ncbi:MAG TPA: recombinase family protein [Terriglobales bacterium]|jgi:DNA invertase Pin-like site-specific DNA recombinase|nr:recombinase family protein [Terriglobales bacterium]
MRVAVYGRVSTKDKGQDVENQLTQLRDFATRQRWEIAHEYIDQTSGGTSDREQFQQMFKDASQKRFDVLLFWSLDRLSREGVLPTLQYLTRLSDYGIVWRSFTEQYLDSTGIFKDAVIGILAAIAKQEKVRISERTRAGLDRARRQGKSLGRPKVQVNSDLIRALRAKGVSWDAIAQQTGIARATCQRAVILLKALTSI